MRPLRLGSAYRVCATANHSIRFIRRRGLQQAVASEPTPISGEVMEPDLDVPAVSHPVFEGVRSVVPKMKSPPSPKPTLTGSTMEKLKREISEMRLEQKAATATLRARQEAARTPVHMPVEEMQLLQTIRDKFLSDTCLKDVHEVTRKNFKEYMKRLPELDPAEQKRRSADADAFRSRLFWKNFNSSPDWELARLQCIEKMSDAELRAALRCGAIDPQALMDGERSIDCLPDGFVDVNAESGQEAVQSSLRPATTLMKELTLALNPHTPKDDEAELIVRAKKDPKSFTLEEIDQLEKYEHATRERYVSQPNVFLRLAAENETKIRESLDVLDKVRRALTHDQEFQEATQYAEDLTQMRYDQKKVSPVIRTKAVDDTIFFNQSYSRPPPRAAGLPAPEAPANVKQMIGKARRRQLPKRYGETKTPLEERR